MEYTAVVKRNGEWWIGWIAEVPGVNCQERTHEQLRQSLVETLLEALEFNRSDALAACPFLDSRFRGNDGLMVRE